MKTIVTGGAGFIGSHVADALVAADIEVIIIDDLSSGNRANLPSDARFVELDIRDGERVRKLVSDERPDVICHQAAQTSVSVSTREPVRDADINILGSLHLLEAARSVGARFVFASTGGAIYGEVPDGELATEDWTPRPISPYACSKFGFEQYLHAARSEHGLKTTILRYANVYGPRQDPHGEAGVVAIFARRLHAGEAIRVNAMREPGDGGCIRDYVYVDDVVKANLLAVRGIIESEILNVGTGIGTSTGELADQLRKHLKSESPVQDGPRREGDLERSVLAPNPELSSHLGQEPAATSLREGIAKTADWFAAH